MLIHCCNAVGKCKVIYYVVGVACIGPNSSSVVVLGVSFVGEVAEIYSRSFRAIVNHDNE